MGSAFTFPGVYTQEQDFSIYVPALTTMTIGMVGTASKGPVDTLTLITSEEALINTFGFPSTLHKGLLAAQQYLRTGNQLWFVRVTGYDEATATGVLRNAADSADAVTLTASSPGSWANGSSGVSVEVVDGDIAGTYTLRIRWNGFLVETFDNVVMNPSTDDNFIETRLLESDYVTAAVTPGETSLQLTSGVTLSGGDDGAGVVPSDVVGQIVGSTKTGLKLFSSVKEIDINTIAAPGLDHKAVVAELIALAEARQDTFALVDAPFGLSSTEIVDWHNGQLGGDPRYPDVTLNSSYAGLYWPWAQVFDSFNNESVWAPPSGFAAQSYAYTDQQFDTWFAPAGYRRGRLPQILATEIVPTDGQGQYMYGGNAGQFGINAVNPIMNFLGEGTFIWGQRTLQRAPTALDRVNVRRMLLYLRKVIATATRYLVFEPNDEAMWDDFKGLVIPFLRTVKNGRGLRDYRVIMDESTNPPSLVDQNQALGRILLKPTKAAEVINISFALLPQGANFDEFIINTAL